MSEKLVIKALKDAGVKMIASLPCDRNKALTKALPEHFKVVDLTREEDGVGICAGAFLAGTKAAISIQSSGIGNMLNAMMSLTSVYKMPLPILASWRGMDDEPIEAQKPFNVPLPKLFDAYGIHYEIFSKEEDLLKIEDIVKKAFEENAITVALIKPECWSGKTSEAIFKGRARTSDLKYHRKITEPKMYRLDAIRSIMDTIDNDTIVVSNIGIPSKETYASRDRDLNFYMLGSYTQATPIGLGMALNTKRRVIVIDGDGSLLGSSIFAVVSEENPENLMIVCVDNGTFGSTGNQMTAAYSLIDFELVARAFGIKDTMYSAELCGIVESIRKQQNGTRFLHVMAKPGNSASPNIPLSAVEIKDRFMRSV